MNDREKLFDEWRAQADPRTPPDCFDAWLVAEVERLRAELAAARAEPPHPAAMVRGKGCGEWHAFERREEARRFVEPAPLNPWYPVESWHWHPESS